MQQQGLLDALNGGNPVSATNPLAVDVTPGAKASTEILNVASLAAASSTVLGDCTAIDLSNGAHTLTITVVTTYDVGATRGINIHVLTSYDGTNYDTVDFDSWDAYFTAGGTIQQTVSFDVSPRYIKILVENLDGAQAVTDTKIYAVK